MGDNSSGFQQGREQLNGTGLHVLHHTKHRYFKPTNPVKKRMESKLLIGIFSTLGISGYTIAILLNIGTWKSFILFVIFALYGLARVVFYCIRQYQESKLREIEIKERNKKFDDEILPHQ